VSAPIARRPRVSWSVSLIIAIVFGAVVMPILTVDRWIGGFGRVTAGEVAPVTVRVPPFANNGGIVIARGEVANRDDAAKVAELRATEPTGPGPYVVMFAIAAVLALWMSWRLRQSKRGQLVRVQVVNLALVVGLAAIAKAIMLATPTNVLLVPVALLAILPTLVLDRAVGVATGVVAAVIVALCVPFDVAVVVLLLLQVAAARFATAEWQRGVVERPKQVMPAILRAGLAAIAIVAGAYPALLFLIAGRTPISELSDPLRSAWVAAVGGAAIATILAIALVRVYQMFVGEITPGALVALEDRSHPLLKQIAERSPGTWQASLMIANLGENAANAIGANGRLVRVGAYYHDLGKSLQPKYFVENLEPGETSPHDKLPPDASCDAIFAHVTEGIVAGRKAGLHERIIDFVGTHHSDGVLDYFWDRCQTDGNPKKLTVDYFKYPGLAPQSRETAILAICDAVEAASRTLKRSDPVAIEALVQRIVYGKLQLGQLDESGLTPVELREIADSLCETIRQGIHGRTDNLLPKADQSASAMPAAIHSSPRLDAHDRSGRAEAIRATSKRDNDDDALSDTEGVGATPKLKRSDPTSGPLKPVNNELAHSSTAPIPLLDRRESDRDIAVTGRVGRDSQRDLLADVGGQVGAAIGPRESQKLPKLRDPRDSERDVAQTIAMAAERARIAAEDADRATRDSRREADRAAMAQRYAASRDSDPGTKEVELADDEPRNQPRTSDAPIHSSRDVYSSRDGSRRVQHSKPSDGGEPTSSERSRANKRTNETDARNRISGDFVANNLVQPLVKDAIPTSLSDADTGRHGKAPPGNDKSDRSREIDLFTAEATRALRIAAPDLDNSGARVIGESEPPPITARKRAATLPPTAELLRPPTISPPKRASTSRPPGEAALPNGSAELSTSRPPGEAALPNGSAESINRPDARTLVGGGEIRQPANREQTGPQPKLESAATRAGSTTSPVLPRGIDVDASRDERARARDDAAATQPSMASIKISDLAEVNEFNRYRADAAVTRPLPQQTASTSGELESATTQPAMPRAIAEDNADAEDNNDVGDDTHPSLQLPLPAPVFSDPAILLDTLATPPPIGDRRVDRRVVTESAAKQQNTWARGLAARVDEKMDDDFHRDTPTRPPSRAELQALVDAPPDATRQQSLEEIERLRFEPAARRSEQELFSMPQTRRAPYPTAEVNEEDIEAAIEIAPSARRTGQIPIGIAKKKPPTE
jgi:cyclic-di-AMP phosphodiesterase PgpH